MDLGRNELEQRTPLQRRIDYKRAHPEVRIMTPLDADDGLWHVWWTNGRHKPQTFNSAEAMMDRLEGATGG
jgi:hypothetical protein